MGFDDGQIVLDSENGAYYAGQTVRGKMMFSQGKVKTIHGIYVDFKGFCKVHWTTSTSRRVNDRTVYSTVNHDSHEEYFRNKVFVFGNEHGENNLPAGQHEFKFECPIPINCPSTFEGTYGHIRYRVKVVMVTSGMFTMNKDKWVPIRVHAPLDLNQNPYCRTPIEYDLSSTYCCWCVSAGASQIRVTLPVGGYCPGQVIPMEVTCKNDSNVEIDEIKFALKKDVKFVAISQPGTRNEHDTVAEIKKGPIPERTTRNWTVEMVVPAMDIYNVDACRYIDINYSFKVSTEVSGCHEGTDETHPIIMGTIPLVGFQDNVPNPLADQLPKPMQMQIAPNANCYPPPPIINQPYPNSNNYPNNTPYPGAPGFPTTPNLGGRTSPYPGNQPFPNASPYPPNPPYPGGNPPYPGENPPYPDEKSPFLGPNPPYPGGNSPYPPGNSPYPGNTPYSSDKSPHGSHSNLASPYPGAKPVAPYPGANPSPGAPYPGASPSPGAPYPGANPSPGAPYPGASPSPGAPYPGASPSPGAPFPRQSPVPPYMFKTGTIGFGAHGEGDGSKMPSLPKGAGLPYPMSPGANPYSIASAPEPSTPGSDIQKPPIEDSSDPPPYNPEYMKRPEEKKNENDSKQKESEKENQDEKEPK